MYKRTEDPHFKQIKKEVLKRDGYKCQLCGKKKTRLNIHHIKSWSKSKSNRMDPRNLITLCWSCHRDIRGKESQYESLFTTVAFQNEEINRKK